MALASSTLAAVRMAGADLLVLKTWLMHARCEEWICCTHEQESIGMLLKHNSKLSFIPLVRAKPALPTWNSMRFTPKAHSCSTRVHKSSAGMTGAGQASCAAWPAGCRVELDTTGVCWRAREWAVNQGADTKLSFIQCWGVPSAKISDTLHLESQQGALSRHKGDVCWCLRVTGAAGTEVWVMCEDKQMQECTGKAKGPSEQVPARVKHSATFSCT